MTLVHFDLADPAGDPLAGYVSLVPTRRVTVGDEIRLPTALRVRLESGEASVELMPSTTQWVWRVSELVPGGITRYVSVPDSEGTVEYAALESVDPASLDVSSASVPAWEIATRTAQETLDKVGEIDGKVERAEDAAAGAESSAGAAESHETAARSSADSAASSARDAASSATAAASSAGSAASSASAAASSAEQATSIVASVSGSVTQAENAAQSASQSATTAAGSASAAGGSAQAAADSASKAGESATAAKTSETNAASSASAAKVSETNAAASATEAREAVDGFGLEVGTTTTGEPGSDAAVSIAKQGKKYVADFTIPRGEKGDPGSGGGISSIVTDTTLTGDGTSANKLGIADAMIPTKAQSITDSSLTKWNGGGYYKVPIAVYSDAPEKYSTVKISGTKIELNGIGANNGDSNISILIITGKNGSKAAEELYINLSGYGHDSKKWYAIPNENTIEDALPSGSIPNDGAKFQQSVNDTPDTPTDILKLAGGYWNLNGYFTNLPSVYDSATKYYGTMLYVASNSGVSYRFLTIIKGDWAEFPRFFIYMTGKGNIKWVEVAFQSDLANYVPLSTYQALEARVQALEAKLA